MTEHPSEDGLSRRHRRRRSSRRAACWPWPRPLTMRAIRRAGAAPRSPRCFPGFPHLDMRTSGAVIRLRHGGSGPPLLLAARQPAEPRLLAQGRGAAGAALSRHPARPARLRRQLAAGSRAPTTSTTASAPWPRTWWRSWSSSATAISSSPATIAARARRIACAWTIPERIIKVCLMDIVPNHYVWTHTTKNWAIGTWHWGFMAQPEPFPERLISAVPAEFFLKSRMVIRGGTGLGFLTEAALAEYVRCYTLKTITGSCRDYRASPTMRLRHGHRRQGQTDRDAAAAPVGRARPAAGARARVRRRSGANTPTNIVDTEPCRAATTCRKRCPTTSTNASSRFSRMISLPCPQSIDTPLALIAPAHRSVSLMTNDGEISRRRALLGDDRRSRAPSRAFHRRGRTSPARSRR